MCQLDVTKTINTWIFTSTRRHTVVETQNGHACREFTLNLYSNVMCFYVYASG